MSSTNNCQFIVYACPVGKLNSQLKNYFACSRELCGENTAHKYMPHCTLTGFFKDRPSSIPNYIQALDRALAVADWKNSPLKIELKQLTFNDNWHGLELQGDRLKKLIVDFTNFETSQTRQGALRLKDWLHLSLAYNFHPEHEAPLRDLAIKAIDLNAAVNWELRFYQKNPDWTWQCLESWNISGNPLPKNITARLPSSNEKY